MPWPKEQVVIQQGCSHQEELRLFHVADHGQTYSRGMCTHFLKLMVRVLVEGGGADSTVAACSLSQVYA